MLSKSFLQFKNCFFFWLTFFLFIYILARCGSILLDHFIYNLLLWYLCTNKEKVISLDYYLAKRCFLRKKKLSTSSSRQDWAQAGISAPTHCPCLAFMGSVWNVRLMHVAAKDQPRYPSVIQWNVSKEHFQNLPWYLSWNKVWEVSSI